MHKASFTDAIKEATAAAMEADRAVHVVGLGVSYPNGADGTTAGLAERFPDRVHDVPCSEAAITGMAVGAAAMGLRPIVHHGRVEFGFFASDQILTQAAKWSYMFGGNYPVPAVFRLCIGRQWGNGPQHTQVARGMFAIPGLKVVAPSTPLMAKRLLLAAVADQNPIVYLEHRWLYKLRQSVDNDAILADLSRAMVVRAGSDVTIVGLGDTVVESLKAANALAMSGISAEVIDLVSVYPVDYATIQESAQRTGKLIVVDTATPGYDIGADIVANVSGFETAYRLNSLPVPCPTAPSLTAGYYPTCHEIFEAAERCMLPGNLQSAGRVLLPEKTFASLHLPPTHDLDELMQ